MTWPASIEAGVGTSVSGVFDATGAMIQASDCGDDERAGEALEEIASCRRRLLIGGGETDLPRYLFR